MVLPGQSLHHKRQITWAYGVTTCLARCQQPATLLQGTLASLAGGGFDRPTVFADGLSHMQAFQLEQTLGLSVVTRQPPNVRAYGNWCLALGELFIRNPQADLYALFQDDFLTVRNLRAYLERSIPPLSETVPDPTVRNTQGFMEVPVRRYWNLYTFRDNEAIIRGKPRGWHEAVRQSSSNPVCLDGRPLQRGLGAVGLVFSREGVMTLLSHPHMVRRPLDPIRGYQLIDAGVVTAMGLSGWTEYVHNPSLVQHEGHESTIRTKRQLQALSFPGEEVDALSFLPSQ